MRATSEKIIKLIVNKKEGTVSVRDRVEKHDDTMCALLHGTVYAEISDMAIKLGVYGGRWQSATTKQRINAIAFFYGLPGIYQKNYIWYWADNNAIYTGIREFVK